MEKLVHQQATSQASVLCKASGGSPHATVPWEVCSKSLWVGLLGLALLSKPLLSESRFSTQGWQLLAHQPLLRQVLSPGKSLYCLLILPTMVVFVGMN